MRRVLLQWGAVQFYSYPTMLALGIVVGMFAQQAAAARMGLDVPWVSLATLILLVPALVGARLFFVLSHWAAYRGVPHSIWKRTEGGATMYGGLFLALPISILVLKVLGVPFWRFWDSAAFTMLAGMVITRGGCLLNGCCSGKPTGSPLGMYLPNARGVWTRRIPTQLLEGAWGAVVLGGACALWSTHPYEGAVFLYAVSAYAAGRTVLELGRENQERVLGLRLQRALSVVLIAVSLAVVIAAWRN